MMKILLAGGTTIALMLSAMGAAAQPGSTPQASDATVDPFLAKAALTAPNREPAIAHPVQAKAAETTLAALRAHFGHAPNIVVILLDDVGWGDCGVFGGGGAIGAPTPNIDRLAQSGLRLTSAYSQPSCTPTRSALLTGRLPMRTGLLTPAAAGLEQQGGGPRWRADTRGAAQAGGVPDAGDRQMAYRRQLRRAAAE